MFGAVYFGEVAFAAAPLRLAIVPLAPAVAVSSGTLALTASTAVPLAASAAVASGTAAVAIPTPVGLGASAATASGTLVVWITDTLIPNGDGTVTGWDDENQPLGPSLPLSDSIDDYAGGGAHDSDTTFVRGPNNADSSAFFALTDLGANFNPATINQVTLTVAYRKESAGVVQAADQIGLAVRLFKANETTVLTDVVTVATDVGTGFVETTVTLPNPDTAASIADWNGARLRVTQDYTVQGLGDVTTRLRVSAVRVAVVYVPSAAAADLSLAASAATASPTLALSASTRVPLGAATGTATAALALAAPTAVPLGPAAGTATVSLALTAPTGVPLDASSGVSTGSLEMPQPVFLTLGTSGTTAATLVLSALTGLTLAPVAATSSATLVLLLPFTYGGGPDWTYEGDDGPDWTYEGDDNPILTYR